MKVIESNVEFSRLLPCKLLSYPSLITFNFMLVFANIFHKLISFFGINYVCLYVKKIILFMILQHNNSQYNLKEYNLER